MTFLIPPKYKNFLFRFYRLATVSILANMMVPLAGLCDTAFLGHLEDIRYLAGVILGSILFDYLYRILKFLRSGTNAITAQAVGNEDDQGIILAVLRSGLITVIIAFFILILQVPIEKFGFMLLSGSPEIELSGIDYFNARIWGTPAVLLNFVFIGWFLGREMKGYILLLSLVGNGSNVLLDYFMISRWGWGSMGAGWATAISQYLALFVAIIGMILTIRWDMFRTTLQKTLDFQALQEIIALKGNIFIRFLVLISVYSIFTNLSALFGTTVLAANGLLLQIALLSQFTIQGVGMTTQTLTGNFKGKGMTEEMMPLLIVSIITSLVISSGFSTVPILFPETVFGLLTNHTEINESVAQYIGWLFPLLTLTSTTFMLEGYLIGLKEVSSLRDGVLLAFVLGFLPLAGLGWYWQNNHLLWMSLISYMMMLMTILGTKLPQINRNYNLQLPKLDNQ